MNYQTQQEAKAAHAREIKENATCADCYFSGATVTLVFVRSDGTNSPRYVSQLVQRGTFEALVAEIELSDLVCRACKSNRLRTRKRRRQMGNAPSGSAQARKRRAERRRSAIQAIKDQAPCVTCGKNLGHERMRLVLNEEHNIDGYTKSVNRTIGGGLSTEQLLAAMYGSDIICEDCFDVPIVEWYPESGDRAAPPAPASVDISDTVLVEGQSARS